MRLTPQNEVLGCAAKLHDFVPFCMDMACFIPKELIGLTSHQRYQRPKAPRGYKIFKFQLLIKPITPQLRPCDLLINGRIYTLANVAKTT